MHAKDVLAYIDATIARWNAATPTERAAMLRRGY